MPAITASLVKELRENGHTLDSLNSMINEQLKT